MRGLLFVVLLLLSSGCITTRTNQYETLTNEECRGYGVDTPRYALPTGTIVSSNMGTEEDIERECANWGVKPLFWAGCAKAASKALGSSRTSWEGEPKFPAIDGRYEIWYIDHECTAKHEACHALYQARHHTKEYEDEARRIGYRATCPN